MKKSCFLFGHSDTPQSVFPLLERAIESEIAKGITDFYVGYRGSFDRLAASALVSAKKRHPQISVMLVLSYHPAEAPVEAPQGFDGTYYPPLEDIPRKYAIIHANQHMLKTADSLICYAEHFGNAQNLFKAAVRAKRCVVNLAGNG